MRRSALICVVAAAGGLAAPSIAAAATTFGAPALTPAPSAGTSCPAAAMSCLTVLAPPAMRAPSDGVVVAWRINAIAGDEDLRLRAVRLSAAGWQPVASDAAVRTVHGGTVESFAARLPVRAGDALALDGDAVPGALDVSDPGPLAVLAGPLADGDPARAADAAPAAGLLVQADLEADGDGDGYGDETQDACPQESARFTAPCTAALSVRAAAPEWGVIDHPAAQAFDVVNHGPSAAASVSLALNVPSPARLVDVQTTQGTCTASTCTLGRIPAGSVAHVVVQVTRDDVGDVRSDAMVSSTALDAENADDAATAVTTFTPPSVAPPPVVFAMPPCVNVRIGTFDDEVISGTAFGDRLVGRGGRDLIDGDGGPDCLEGGTGDDVLAGGDGDDRLSGGFGDDRLYGDAGNDRLDGGRGRDTVAGGPGNDLLLPGPGSDRVLGGSGNDTVSARDGARDVVDCGPGRDTARVDRIDRVSGCEVVDRR